MPLKNKLIIGFGLSLLFNAKIFSQALPGTLNWYNGVGTGMQTDKAYKLLKSKKTKAVIVAVIDSGLASPLAFFVLTRI